MPRGDKSKYSDKQERKVEHIEESYEKQGISKDEAKARACSTVNKQSGGGEQAGSGTAKSGTAKSADCKDFARRAVATKQGQSPNSGKATARRSRSRSSSSGDMTQDELVKKAAEQSVHGRSRMKKNELIRALSQ